MTRTTTRTRVQAVFFFNSLLKCRSELRCTTGWKLTEDWEVSESKISSEKNLPNQIRPRVLPFRGNGSYVEPHNTVTPYQKRGQVCVFVEPWIFNYATNQGGYVSGAVYLFCLSDFKQDWGGNYHTDFHENWWKGEARAKEDPSLRLTAPYIFEPSGWK